MSQETERGSAMEPVDLTGCEHVVPMAEWVRRYDEETSADPETCVPCLTGTVAAWYRDKLREVGYAELADRLVALASGRDPDPMEVAAELDDIKRRVDNPTVRDYLVLYDCAVQFPEALREEERDG